MNRIFGTSSSAKPKATLADAVAGNETRIDGLEVKIRKLDGELTRHRDQLKRLRDGPGKVCGPVQCLPRLLADHPAQAAVQQKALRVLKQRKMCVHASPVKNLMVSIRSRRYEAQRDQLQQQSYNMEQASMTTENLRNTMATVDAMKTANKEIKRQYGKIDIDKIEVRSRSYSVLWYSR